MKKLAFIALMSVVSGSFASSTEYLSEEDISIMRSVQGPKSCIVNDNKYTNELPEGVCSSVDGLSEDDVSIIKSVQRTL